MLATIINAAAVLLGGLLGLLLGDRLQEARTKTIVSGLGICTLVIGMTQGIKTENILVVILCLVFGTLVGELLDIEARLDRLGDWLKARISGPGAGRFTEGFVTASLLYCVGSMTIMGCLDAGLRGDYQILFTKSAMDGIMAVTFGATMGVGVLFSALSVLVIQGSLTLLAGVVEPFLTQPMLTEMCAVGGVMLLGTGFNILGMGKERIKVGNMLPALLLPALWFGISAQF